MCACRGICERHRASIKGYGADPGRVFCSVCGIALRWTGFARCPCCNVKPRRGRTHVLERLRRVRAARKAAAAAGAGEAA